MLEESRLMFHLLFFLESTLQDFVQKEGSRGESLSNESLIVPLMFPSKERETINRNYYSDLEPWGNSVQHLSESNNGLQVMLEYLRLLLKNSKSMI